MEAHTQTVRTLADTIKCLSPQPMPDAKAAEGARNLAGFFELLLQIDQETQQKR